jgi:hypothetical protein
MKKVSNENYTTSSGLLFAMYLFFDEPLLRKSIKFNLDSCTVVLSVLNKYEPQLTP